jgi:transcriptional regulator with XRE-family HTH domain
MGSLGHIGKRILEMRIVRGLRQQDILKNRSYLYKVEAGSVLPGLAVLEILAATFDVGIARFFISEEEHIAMLTLEDPFCIAIIPFLKRLNEEQRREILKTIDAAPKQKVTLGRRKT